MCTFTIQDKARGWVFLLTTTIYDTEKQNQNLRKLLGLREIKRGKEHNLWIVIPLNRIQENEITLNAPWCVAVVYLFCHLVSVHSSLSKSCIDPPLASLTCQLQPRNCTKVILTYRDLWLRMSEWGYNIGKWKEKKLRWAVTLSNLRCKYFAWDCFW